MFQSTFSHNTESNTNNDIKEINIDSLETMEIVNELFNQENEENKENEENEENEGESIKTITEDREDKNIEGDIHENKNEILNNEDDDEDEDEDLSEIVPGDDDDESVQYGGSKKKLSDSDDEPLGADSEDEPLGADSDDEPLGDDSEDEPLGKKSDSDDKTLGLDEDSSADDTEQNEPLFLDTNEDDGQSWADMAEEQLEEKIVNASDYPDKIPESTTNIGNVKVGDIILLLEKSDKWPIKKSGNKFHGWDGTVIFKSDDKVTLNNYVEYKSQKNEDIQYITLDISEKNLNKYGINEVRIIEKTLCNGYMDIHDIRNGSKVRIVTKDKKHTLSNKKGTIINVPDIDNIIIGFDDDTQDLDLDLSQGIEYESFIQDILLDEQNEKFAEIEEIEIMDDEELVELIDKQNIPESERLFTENEQYDDLFCELVSKLSKKSKINEQKIRKQIEKLSMLKYNLTKYSPEYDQVIGVNTKDNDYSPFINNLLDGKLNNKLIIPIISEKKKIYIDGDEEEQENNFNVNVKNELIRIFEAHNTYNNGGYTGMGVAYDYHINEINKITDIMKSKKKSSHTHLVKEDSVFFRESFFNDDCIVYSENDDDMNRTKLHMIRLPGEYYRPTTEVKHSDNNVETIKSKIYSDNVEICGFCLLPKKCDDNINPNDGLIELKYISQQKEKLPTHEIKKIMEEGKLKKKKISTDTNKYRGKKVQVIYTTGEEDDLHIIGEILSIDRDHYHIQPSDLDLRTHSDSGIWSIPKNNANVLPYFDKGEKVKACIVDDESDDILELIGEIDHVDKENAHIKPEDEELRVEEDIWKINLKNEIISFTDDNEPICGDDDDVENEENINVYLFNVEEEINKEILKKLMSNIIPDNKKIIHKFKKDFHKINTIEDVNYLLNKYEIRLDDLLQSDAEVIHKIFDNNIKERIKELGENKKKYKERLAKKKEKHSSKLSENFSDKYLISNNISDHCDVYLFKENLDSNENRFSWLNQSSTSKNVYLNTLSKRFIEEIVNGSEIKSITDRIEKEIEKNMVQLADLEKKHEELKGKTGYFMKKEECKKMKITKMYSNIQELTDDNDKEELFYDKNLDDTDFSIVEEIKREKGDIDITLHREQVIDKLKAKYSDNDADSIESLADDIIRGGKIVKINDFCVLKMGEKNKLWKRIRPSGSNPIWVLQPHLRDISDENILCNNTVIDIYGTHADEVSETIAPEELSVDTINSDNRCQIKNEQCIPNDEFKLEETIKKLKDINSDYNTEIQQLKNVDKNIENIEDYLRMINRVKDTRNIYKDYKNKKNEEKFREMEEMYLGKSAMKKSKVEKKISKALRNIDIYKRDKELQKIIRSDLLRNALPHEDINWFYSTETNEKVLSVHWEHKIKITLEPKNSDKILRELIKTYGTYDYGSEMIVCKIDGDPLREIDNDYTQSFGEEGQIMSTRDKLILDENDEEDEEEEDLSKKYIKGSDSHFIFNIIKSMSSSLHVKLRNDDTEDIIRDSILFLKEKCDSKHKWIEEKRDKRMTTKKPKKKLKKKEIDRDLYNKDTAYKQQINTELSDEYESYKSLILLTFTSARILISLQVSIPNYEFSGIFPNCNFSIDGFKMEEVTDESKVSGLDYMACILDAKKISGGVWDTLSKLKREKIKGVLKDQIEIWYNSKDYIRLKYDNKRIYNTELESKKKHIIYDSSYFKPGTITNDTEEEIEEIDINSSIKNINIFLKKGNSSDIKKMLSKIKIRKEWLIKKLMYNINQFISSNKVEYGDIIHTVYTENTCCYENVNEYNNYVNKFITEYPDLEKYINELNSIDRSGILNINAFEKPLRIDTGNVQTRDNLTNDFFSNLSEKDRYRFFMKYSNSEDTIGCERIINKSGIDVITGLKSAALKINDIDEQIELLKSEDNAIDDDVYTNMIGKINKKNIFPISEIPYEYSIVNVIEKLKNTIPELNDDDILSNLKDGLDGLFSNWDSYNPQQIDGQFVEIFGEISSQTEEITNNITDTLSHNLSLDDESTKNILETIRNIDNLGEILGENSNDIEILQEKLLKKQILLLINCICKIKNNISIKFKIPNKWELAPNHKEKVIDYLNSNNAYLTEFQKIINKNENSVVYHQLFRNIYTKFTNLKNIINDINGYSDIRNEDKEILKNSQFRHSESKYLLHYILIKSLHVVLNSSNLIEGEDSIYEQDDLLSGNTDEVDTKYQMDDEFSGGMEKIHQEKENILSNFIKIILYKMDENRSMLNISNQQIQVDIGISKETEKNEMIQKIDAMDDEQTKVNKALKAHKLGDWSKGLRKQYEYQEDDFGQDKQQDDFYSHAKSKAREKYGDEFSSDQLELVRDELSFIDRRQKEEQENFDMSRVYGDADDMAGDRDEYDQPVGMYD